jgi:hypothetical protein
VEVATEGLADIGVGATGGISCRGLGLILPSFGLDALILNDETREVMLTCRIAPLSIQISLSIQSTFRHYQVTT